MTTVSVTIRTYGVHVYISPSIRWLSKNFKAVYTSPQRALSDYHKESKYFLVPHIFCFLFFTRFGPKTLLESWDSCENRKYSDV